MVNGSSCLKASLCAALLMLGCMPTRTEAVSTKSLLAGVVGLTALGASQAGPISGVVAYGATHFCGWLAGVMLTSLAIEKAPLATGGAALVAGVGVATVGVTATVAAGTTAVGAVTAAVAGYGAAVHASAMAVSAFFTTLPFLP